MTIKRGNHVDLSGREKSRKHKPFDDASPDIVAYVRYLEVIAGKSPNTAFSYYCDLRNFSRFMNAGAAL